MTQKTRKVVEKYSLSKHYDNKTERKIALYIYICISQVKITSKGRDKLEETFI